VVTVDELNKLINRLYSITKYDNYRNDLINDLLSFFEGGYFKVYVVYALMRVEFARAWDAHS